MFCLIVLLLEKKKSNIKMFCINFKGDSHINSEKIIEVVTVSE